jgi:hypothetical protein
MLAILGSFLFAVGVVALIWWFVPGAFACYG